MSFAEILVRYGGRKLDISSVSIYDQWAIAYFSDRSIVADPTVELTLQLDITESEAFYRMHRAAVPGASLTAWLTWTLLRSLSLHPCFSWRAHGGDWYEFGDLPLCFPVATGTASRYQDVLIHSASKMSWVEFACAYRREVERALEGQPFFPIPDDVWNLSWLIGNMRQFSFTSLRAFVSRLQAGRPVFYFGKRYTSEGRLHAPLYVMFDHSTTEPARLESLLSDFEKIRTGQVAEPSTVWIRDP